MNDKIMTCSVPGFVLRLDLGLTSTTVLLSMSFMHFVTKLVNSMSAKSSLNDQAQQYLYHILGP